MSTPSIEASEVDSTKGTSIMDSPKPKSPLSPQLKIEPASKWADKTFSALNSTNNVTPVTTPGPNLPGAYPDTPSVLQPGPSFGEVRDVAKEYLQAAGQYVPTQEDLKKAAQNAGSTIRGYIPNGVATYLGPPNRQEAVTASPIDESETTPTTGDGFVLLNRGIRETGDRTQGNHDVQHDFTNGSGPKDGKNTRPNASENLEANGRSLPDSARLDVPLNSGNGKASENASMRTQPGSRAVSERDTDGIPTPFSYTGQAADVTSLIAQGDSEVRTSPKREARGILTEDTPLERNSKGRTGASLSIMGITLGHPNGVINHGDLKAELLPGGEGVLTAPDSGVAAGPGPGPDITKHGTGTEDGGEKRLSRNTGNGKETENQNIASLKGEYEGPEKSHGDLKPKRFMDDSTVHTAARTHPLGKEGAQWKGVPLEEKYQAALDRDENRGLTIGESQPPAIASAKAGTIPRRGDSPSLKPSIRNTHSSTATTGHGGEFPHSNEQAPGQPRPVSPMTAEENPHVGRAVGGPNSKKLREPNNGDAEGEQSRGRRRDIFLNKIKTWSKRLSRERKAKN